MKIFLDDEREEPPGWIRVRWPDEAIELLKKGGVEIISLDHDLGDDTIGTGYDVVLWLEEQANHQMVPPEINPSANSSARIKMLAGIERIKRFAASRS